MVGRRTLNPSIQVRILAWEPTKLHLDLPLLRIKNGRVLELAHAHFRV